MSRNGTQVFCYPEEYPVYCTKNSRCGSRTLFFLQFHLIKLVYFFAEVVQLKQERYHILYSQVVRDLFKQMDLEPSSL